MNRRELTAWYVNCRPEELRGFVDYGDHVAAILPDGRKWVIESAVLEAARVAAEAGQAGPVAEAQAAEKARFRAPRSDMQTGGREARQTRATAKKPVKAGSAPVQKAAPKTGKKRNGLPAAPDKLPVSRKPKSSA